jgi:hypothetical protein
MLSRRSLREKNADLDAARVASDDTALLGFRYGKTGEIELLERRINAAATPNAEDSESAKPGLAERLRQVEAKLASNNAGEQ